MDYWNKISKGMRDHLKAISLAYGLELMAIPIYQYSYPRLVSIKTLLGWVDGIINCGVVNIIQSHSKRLFNNLLDSLYVTRI